MKRRLGQFILTLAAAAAFTFALAGCGEEEEVKLYDHLVTFDYNVGNLLGEPEKDEDGNVKKAVADQYLGVAANSLVVVQPGNSAGVKFDLSEISGYYIEGWYRAKVDEEGNAVIGEDGRAELAEKWDFSADRVDSDITLYAKLLPRPKLSIMVDGVAQKVFSDLPGRTFSKPSISVDIPTKPGHTLYGYYNNPECTDPMEWPYTFGTEDKIVYTKFEEGVWTFVKDASGFLNALALNENIWLENDIDFSGAKWNGNYNYRGTLNGKGHALTGIACSYDAAPSTGTDFALFGTLASTAHIYDLVIEDAQITVSAMMFGDYRVAMLAHEVRAGANIENVTVTGKLTGKRGDSLEETDAVRMELFPVCFNYDEAQESFTNCNFGGVVTENLTANS